MRHFIIALLSSAYLITAQAGWFGPEFERIKTTPPAGGEDSVLFMTSNGFTSDEKYFVFGRRLEPRASSGGVLGSPHRLFRRDMETGEEVQLTDFRNMSFLNGVVSGDTLFVGLIGKEAGIVTVDVPSGKQERIWDLPPNDKYSKWKLYMLSAALDGTRLLLTIADDVPLNRGAMAQDKDKLQSWVGQYLASDARSMIYLGIKADGKWTFTKVHERLNVSQGWYGHVQLNPVTGEDALIELEGGCSVTHMRASILDFRTGNTRPVRPPDNSICLSHSNYIGDGVVQYLLYEGNRTSFGIADVKQGSYKEYPTEFSHQYGAYLAKDGTVYVFGDGRLDVASPITRYTVRNGRLVDSTTVSERGANTKWEEYLPQQRVSPSGKYLVHTTSDAIGHGQIVIVKDPLKAK